MSLHILPNVTYGMSSTACFIWSQISSIAFRSGQPGGRNFSSRPTRLFEFLLDAFCPVLCCPVQYDQNFAKFCVYRL